LPTPKGIAFLHQVDHWHFLICITQGLSMCCPSHGHNWWFIRHHLKWGRPSCGMFWICCNKIRPTPNGPPNLVDLLPHNSLRIVGSPSWPSRFVHWFGGGRKCSSWAPTPFSSKELAKTCLWTLGFDPRLCSLEDHDAWKPTRFLGRGLILCGNEMCHLVKSIHHHHDGIKAPWWGQTYHEIHGHTFSRPFRNWQRL
jgi:hypothetical protein